MGDHFATIEMGRGLWTQACLRPCNKHTMVSYIVMSCMRVCRK